MQSAESEYVARNRVTLPEDNATDVLKLVDSLEQDDDVQRVFHNLARRRARRGRGAGPIDGAPDAILGSPAA